MMPEEERAMFGPKEVYLLDIYTGNTSYSLAAPQPLWAGDVLQLAFQVRKNIT